MWQSIQTGPEAVCMLCHNMLPQSWRASDATSPHKGVGAYLLIVVGDQTSSAYWLILLKNAFGNMNNTQVTLKKINYKTKREKGVLKDITIENDEIDEMTSCSI